MPKQRNALRRYCVRMNTMLQAALHWFVAAMRRRRRRMELAQLDDHLLRDIGLTGYEVGRKREKPFIEQR
jgi:uncharacterized protein YjiS (DUF1127 family)